MAKPGRKPLSPEMRFWPKVKKTSGCWLWTAAKDEHGYGRFNFNGRSRVAHDIAWVLTHGAIPKGMRVLHRCDNPQCVNLRHLYLGTPADNVRDMMVRKRHWSHKNPQASLRHMKAMRRQVNPVNHSGEKSHRAKLTWKSVDEIRSRHLGPTEMAQKLGVSVRTVWDILYRKTWNNRPPT